MIDAYIKVMRLLALSALDAPEPGVVALEAIAATDNNGVARFRYLSFVVLYSTALPLFAVRRYRLWQQPVSAPAARGNA